MFINKNLGVKDSSKDINKSLQVNVEAKVEVINKEDVTGSHIILNASEHGIELEEGKVLVVELNFN